MAEYKKEAVRLPEPVRKGKISFEEAVSRRRSIRNYDSVPLELADISQLLWSAQGITSTRGLRTAPSAGALYPLEIYLVAGDVRDLPDGVYKYDPDSHELVRVRDGDRRDELCNAALKQTSIKRAAAVLVMSAVYERVTSKYGRRGIQYTHMETGHAAQNVLLQASAIGLGAVVIGAFHDEEVRNVLAMSEEEAPLYIIPVGTMK